jgi:hypothetical protein
MTRPQTVAVVASLAGLVVVALIAGVGQPPEIVDQSSRAVRVAGPATLGYRGPVVIALFTTAFGFVAFVLGQLALKLIVDPIQEQARVVGNVAHALTYYRNVGPNDPTGHGLERAAEARRECRDLAAKLRMNLHVLRGWYRILARLQLVLPEESVRRAAAALIILSVTVQKGPQDQGVLEQSNKVRENLGIER